MVRNGQGVPNFCHPGPQSHVTRVTSIHASVVMNLPSDIIPSATSPTMADNNEKKVEKAENKPEEEKKKLPQLGALEDDDEFEVSAFGGVRMG